jgi:hypothetical protein
LTTANAERRQARVRFWRKRLGSYHAAGPKRVYLAGGELGRLDERVERENRLMVQSARGDAEKLPLGLHLLIPNPRRVQADRGAGNFDVLVERLPLGVHKPVSGGVELALLRIGHVSPRPRVPPNDLVSVIPVHGTAPAAPRRRNKEQSLHVRLSTNNHPRLASLQMRQTTTKLLSFGGI